MSQCREVLAALSSHGGTRGDSCEGLLAQIPAVPGLVLLKFQQGSLPNPESDGL